MAAKGVQLEKWLSAFFDLLDSKLLAKGQQLLQSKRLFGFEESGSQVGAMVHGDQVYKVTVYYEETDLTELGLPDPKKLVCACTCQTQAAFCEHSICTILCWALQTEKALRRVIQEAKPGSGERFQTDLTLKRLENAAQSTPGPFDNVLKGYSGDHPLDGLMKNVYRQFIKTKGSND